MDPVPETGAGALAPRRGAGRRATILLGSAATLGAAVVVVLTLATRREAPDPIPLHAVRGGKVNFLPADDGRAGEAFVIGLYGDTQGTRSNHERILARLAAMDPDFVAMSGDCVDDSSNRREWADFLEASALLRSRVPFLVARGNHDRGDAWERAFATPSGSSNYVLDFRHLRLVVLDTERRSSVESDQGRWLKAELEKARSRPFTIVLSHKPVISSGEYYTKDDSAESEDAKRLGPLFLATGVDLSISGHEHFYERLEEGGLTYVVSGGAGQELRGPTASHPASRAFARAHHACRILVRADRIEVTAIDLDGKSLDEVTVRPR